MRRLLPGLFCLLVVTHVWSQQPTPPSALAPTTLRVGFAGAPPFIMPGDDAILATGFSPDLWNDVVAANGWSCSYRRYESTAKALEAVKAGECDVLVGNTSITSDREKVVEFSQPFYRAGLQVMVSEERGSVARVLDKIFTMQNLEVIGLIIICVLVVTAFVAFFERRHNPDFPKTSGAGFVEAFYYVMGLITGKSTYKGFPGVLGRLVLVGWMLASLFTVSIITSVITASMTADILKGSINGPQDLQGKMIGVLGGTQSEEYAQRRNIDYKAYADMDDAVADLVKGTVQCLVGDAPVLEYYDLIHPQIPIHEVGPVFDPVNYGFAMPQNSPLREAINFSLLHFREDGTATGASTIDTLGAKYFGESYQK